MHAHAMRAAASKPRYKRPAAEENDATSTAPPPNCPRMHSILSLLSVARTEGSML